MKKIFTLMLAAGMLLGAASGARAIDFKASGEWLVGFGLGDGSLIKDVNDQKRHHDDTFNAGQRIRLQLDAVASETLSGTVFFEIGDQMWGQSESGGALGADSTSVVKLKNAYIDWMVPNTDLKLRMGLQAVALPNVAGGSAIMDGDAAAVPATSSTRTWASPPAGCARSTTTTPAPMPMAKPTATATRIIWTTWISSPSCCP